MRHEKAIGRPMLTSGRRLAPLTCNLPPTSQQTSSAMQMRPELRRARGGRKRRPNVYVAGQTRVALTVEEWRAFGGAQIVPGWPAAAQRVAARPPGATGGGAQLGRAPGWGCICMRAPRPDGSIGVRWARGWLAGCRSLELAPARRPPTGTDRGPQLLAPVVVVVPAAAAVCALPAAPAPRSCRWRRRSC